MRITPGQINEIRNLVSMAENQLAEPIMDAQKLSEIQNKLSSVMKKVNPPRFFKRLI